VKVGHFRTTSLASCKYDRCIGISRGRHSHVPSLQTDPHLCGLQPTPTFPDSSIFILIQVAGSNLGVYFVLAFSNSSFFSVQSVTALCFASTLLNCFFSSAVSLFFPNSVFKTIRFAIVSAELGSMAIACCSAASASGKRPRWSSETAWATRECGDWDCAVCASSSKT
jgi:hypothetical protein